MHLAYDRVGDPPAVLGHSLCDHGCIKCVTLQIACIGSEQIILDR